MKESTDRLQAPDNADEGARLPDLKVEKDAKLGTDFEVPMQCVSCRERFTVYKGRADVMAAVYDKLLKIDKRCGDCSGGK